MKNHLLKVNTAIKISIAIIVLFLLYLFLLNGRYQTTGADSALMFDNWKKEWILPNKEARKPL
ncbi:MAG: hypothetical protein LBR81_08165 [Prevotellaceae bacterium]|jgi:hypothetical protein|nr:hypothetical protein [Prevotellaceae bacterium]